jgi:CRP-like cAMP-binding protein
MPFPPNVTLADFAGAMGFVGAAIYLSAYTLMQLGLIRGQSYIYAATVIVAASCIAFSLIGAYNPAVLTMQLFYIAISVVGIVRLFVMSRMLRVSEEERALIQAHLPDLPPQHARPLLRRGSWVDLAAGQVLAEEGRLLDRLIFLSAGRAVVTIGGRSVGTCENTFIGELTFLTGEPATATVVMDEPGRAFVFDSARLRGLVARVPEIKLALIAGFTGATKALLLRRNREAVFAEAALE